MNTRINIIGSRVLSLLVVSACAAPAPAQPGLPPNDECDTAEVISGEAIFPFDNIRPYELFDEMMCDFVNDVWYCWTSPCTGHVTIDTCGTTSVDTVLNIYQGCTCPPTQMIETDCGSWGQDPVWDYWPFCGFQSRVTFDAIEGESYLIRLGTSSMVGADAGGGTGSFTIDCGMPVEPPCVCVEPSDPGPVDYVQCPSPDTFDAIASTRGVATGAAQFTPTIDGSVTDLCFWGMYLDEAGDCSFTATNAFEIRYFTDDGGLPGAMMAGPFVQADGSLTLVGPARTDRFAAGIAHEYEYSATHADVPVTAGTCYWVEVTNAATGACQWLWSVTTDDRGRAVQDGGETTPPDGYNHADAIGSHLAFRTNIVLGDTRPCAQVPANDTCEAAMPVSDGAHDFDTRGATTSGPLEPGQCDPSSGWCCDFALGDENVNQDVWFDYTATCGGVLTVDVDASAIDTKVAVYDGADCPPTGFAIACDDDLRGIAGPRHARAALHVTQGHTYKIRVGGFREAAGWGTMDLDCGPPPPNDACADASVEQLPFIFEGSNEHTTTDCPQIPGTHAWLAFVLPETGAVSLDYAGSPSPFVVASSYVTTDCSCGLAIEADLTSAADDGNPTLGWHCLAAGTYYYPVMAEPGSEGAYQIAVTTGPCADSCTAAEGDCYADNGTPGCEDADCCANVCALDGYCCNSAWDGLCAQVAAVVCDSFPQSVCLEATGDCYEANDSPGCDDQAVCERVCNCDPYCCIIDWDSSCAGSGFLPEPGCGGAADCNGNHILDADEILDPQEPLSADCNDNLLPDECDAIGNGDFNGDGQFDIGDYAYFTVCFRGPNRRPLPPNYLCVGACIAAFDASDNPRPQTVDLADFAVLQNLLGESPP